MILTAALLSLFWVGCDEDVKESSVPDAPVPGISFSEQEKELTIGEEYYLTPTYTRKDGFTLSYVSAAPSVISVDENGKITALLEGTSIVSAIYTDGTTTETADITVHSGFNGNVPTLVLKRANPDGTVSLSVGEEYQLDVEVQFNGMKFNDVDLKYSSEDSDVASVDENGLISPEKIGTTNVVVKGSWRGLDYANKKTLILTVPVTVKNDVVILNDGKAFADTTLYTLSSFAGKSYTTKMPNKFTVVIEGQEYPATVSIADDDIVEIRGSSIKAKTYGSTTLTVSGEGNGIFASRTINITVKRPVEVVEEKVPVYCTCLGTWYDASDGSRKLLSDRIRFNGEITEAWQDGRKLDVVGGTILGIVSSERDKKGEARITIGTVSALYEVTLETFGNVVSVKEDLAYLTTKSSNGYWELLNNVDASGYVVEYKNKTVKFSGIFDGKGYTIKNLTIKEGNSLFGTVVSTTVIRNLGLDNLTATKAFYLAHGNGTESGLTIRNLYIRLNENTQHPKGLISYAGTGNKLENIVIEYTGKNAETNRIYSDRDDCYGSFIGDLPITAPDNVNKTRNFVFDKTFENSWKNIYVISPYVLSFNTAQVGDVKWDGTDVNSAVYSYGKNEETDIYGNTITSKNPDTGEECKKSGVHTRPEGTVLPGDYGKETSDTYYNVRFTTVSRYADKDSMAAAGIVYEFDSEYWDVDNGCLVWKTAR